LKPVYEPQPFKSFPLWTQQNLTFIIEKLTHMQKLI